MSALEGAPISASAAILAAFNLKPLPPEELSATEIYWRDQHDWLKTAGYLLRPRFRPGWIPSWQNKRGINFDKREDSWSPPNGAIMDAVRLSDNSTVVLKKINKSTDHEEEILDFFAALGPSPANHSVPILGKLHPPGDENITIIIMPLLRPYDSPRFDSVGEAVEFFRQIFEGLQFMHHHHVAHRDCNNTNIMMDGQHLYPRGFHPAPFHQHLLPDASAHAPYYTRTRSPVKYYFIDFGISRKYDPANGPPLEEITVGGDSTAPEFAVLGQNYCDPFPTDIYYLGNLIREEFLEGNASIYIPGRLGFEFMRPLVKNMVQADPTLRPNIDTVVAQFAEIQKGLSPWKLRSRVIGRQEYPYLPQRVVGHWYRRIRSIIFRVPATPVPSI